MGCRALRLEREKNNGGARAPFRKGTRAVPLEPSVGLPVGPRRAVLDGENACGHRHWGLR
eukprot:3911905-Pyramimonas_sp.AAC.1